MAEEKNGESGFKVVDRRNFSADGTRRPGGRVEAGEDRPSEFPRRSPPANAAEVEGARKQDYDDSDTNFETLVAYLSTTAMFQLGMLAGPSGEQIPADLVNARRTINLLEVLQQKTDGNLTPEEKNLLEDNLYELRLRFVEAEKLQVKKKR